MDFSENALAGKLNPPSSHKPGGLTVSHSIFPQTILLLQGQLTLGGPPEHPPLPACRVESGGQKFRRQRVGILPDTALVGDGHREIVERDGLRECGHSLPEQETLHRAANACLFDRRQAGIQCETIPLLSQMGFYIIVSPRIHRLWRKSGQTSLGRCDR